MAVVTVTTGKWTCNTEGLWETWTWTPADHVDTTTVPGEAKLAAGETSVVGVSPILFFDPWDYWTYIRLAGTIEDKTEYYVRFKVATTEGGIATATWSEYQNAVGADGSLGFSAGVYGMNHSGWEVGPYIEIELTIRR